MWLIDVIIGLSLIIVLIEISFVLIELKDILRKK